jgi:hypothetical protein
MSGIATTLDLQVDTGVKIESLEPEVVIDREGYGW